MAERIRLGVFVTAWCETGGRDCFNEDGPADEIRPQIKRHVDATGHTVTLDATSIERYEPSPAPSEDHPS